MCTEILFPARWHICLCKSFRLQSLLQVLIESLRDFQEIICDIGKKSIFDGKTYDNNAFRHWWNVRGWFSRYTVVFVWSMFCFTDLYVLRRLRALVFDQNYLDAFCIIESDYSRSRRIIDTRAFSQTFCVTFLILYFSPRSDCAVPYRPRSVSRSIVNFFLGTGAHWCTLHPSSNGARTNTVCRTTVLWSVCCTGFSIAPLDSSAKPAFSLGKPFTKFAMYIRPSTRAFSRRYMKPLLVVKPTHLHPNRPKWRNKNVTIFSCDRTRFSQDFLSNIAETHSQWQRRPHSP